MKITRIDSDRNMNQEVKYVTLQIGDKVYRLSETNEGKLEINKADESIHNNSSITVSPRVTNVIEVD
jgi:hypothetical protein